MSAITLEQRAFRARYEFRGSSTQPICRGVAATFGDEYPIGRGKMEQIARGAFGDAISAGGCKFLLAHGDAGSGLPLAAQLDGSLDLRESDRGLEFEARLRPDDPDYQLLRAKQGLFQECSFAFRIAEDGDTWETRSDGTQVRTVLRVAELADVTVLPSGANNKTRFELNRSKTVLSPQERADYERYRKVNSVTATPGNARRPSWVKEWRIQTSWMSPRLYTEELRKLTPEELDELTTTHVRPWTSIPDYTTSRRQQLESLRASLHRAAPKYTQAAIDDLGRVGKAFKNPDGHYSFPIVDGVDVQNAVEALGRSNANHDAVKRFIIARAKALKLTHLLPASWQADVTPSAPQN